VVVAAVGPLFGRSAEIETMQQLLRRSAAGSGAVAFVEGEPGVGKSRLLIEAMTIAETLGFQV
jgi:predicted ATPase